jgi:hypothetical protein
MANVPAETLELAYKTFRECGQNLSETHRKMNGELGYVISRQSLHEWKTKYDWEGRAARAEAEEKHLANATSDEALLAVLLKQKKKYEDYFDGMAVGTIDNQAVYGYNAILKTIVDIRPRGDAAVEIDRPKIFLENLEWIARALQETDPEGLKILARNFDQLTVKFKAEYLNA